MILLGIAGFFSGQDMSKIASVLIIILGIIAFILGGFSINNPIYVAILIGICLIIQGVRLYISE